MSEGYDNIFESKVVESLKKIVNEYETTEKPKTEVKKIEIEFPKENIKIARLLDGKAHEYKITFPSGNFYFCDDFAEIVDLYNEFERKNSQLNLEVGASVKIRDGELDRCFVAYDDWILKNVSIQRDLIHFAHGCLPKYPNDIYQILKIAPYSDYSDTKLAYIKNVSDGCCYLYRLESLKEV